MSEILEQLTQRDFLMLLVGGGIIKAIDLIGGALIDLYFVVKNRRNQRPFDGWKGGRL